MSEAPANTQRAWVDEALCAQTDPEIFFPAVGAPSQAAKRVCKGCPVRAECLEEALEKELSWGVWGGLSTRQRIRERDRRLATHGIADRDVDPGQWTA